MLISVEIKTPKAPLPLILPWQRGVVGSYSRLGHFVPRGSFSPTAAAKVLALRCYL